MRGSLILERRQSPTSQDQIYRAKARRGQPEVRDGIENQAFGCP